jgi:hypothetical protein
MINAIYTVPFCKILQIKKFVIEYFCYVVTEVNVCGTSTEHCKQAYSFFCFFKNIKYLNNNNNIYLLQLGSYPVAVAILHVYKI